MRIKPQKGCPSPGFFFQGTLIKEDHLTVLGNVCNSLDVMRVLTGSLGLKNHQTKMLPACYEIVINIVFINKFI